MTAMTEAPPFTAELRCAGYEGTTLARGIRACPETLTVTGLGPSAALADALAAGWRVEGADEHHLLASPLTSARTLAWCPRCADHVRRTTGDVDIDACCGDCPEHCPRVAPAPS